MQIIPLFVRDFHSLQSIFKIKKMKQDQEFSSLKINVENVKLFGLVELSIETPSRFDVSELL